jgi:hypothetical protein
MMIRAIFRILSLIFATPGRLSMVAMIGPGTVATG